MSKLILSVDVYRLRSLLVNLNSRRCAEGYIRQWSASFVRHNRHKTVMRKMLALFDSAVYQELSANQAGGHHYPRAQAYKQAAETSFLC